MDGHMERLEHDEGSTIAMITAITERLIGFEEHNTIATIAAMIERQLGFEEHSGNNALVWPSENQYLGHLGALKQLRNKRFPAHNHVN